MRLGVDSGIRSQWHKRFIQTENFVGKVAGSVVENPHIARFSDTATTLVPPSVNTGTQAFSVGGYTTIAAAGDALTYSKSWLAVDAIQQMRFSFDLIAAVERKYAITIPGTNTQAKVTWLKGNIIRLSANWYGYGSNPSGNRALLSIWNVGTGVYDTISSHLLGTIAKLNIYSQSPAAYIDSNGLVTYLAWTNASDGIANSTVVTDYVELTFERLEPSGAYNSIQNFGGKVAGSVVENPHIGRRTQTSHSQITLATPSALGQLFEHVQLHYDWIVSQDTNKSDSTSAINGAISQQLYSFDLVAAFERRYATTVPGANIAAKVAWLKANTAKLTCNWYGYGSGPLGSKAYFAIWNQIGGGYNSNIAHNSGTVAKLSYTRNNTNDVPALGNCIDANGFAHFLAYADASDGATASTIYTDYVELIIDRVNGAYGGGGSTTISNFVGKRFASFEENPHYVYAAGNGGPTLRAPGTFAFEPAQPSITDMSLLNGSSYQTNTITNTYIPQHIFAFDVIAHLQRKTGMIPRDTTAAKVQWIKDNVSVITCNWYGYGSSPLGNKASLATWRASDSTWLSPAITTNGTVTALSNNMKETNASSKLSLCIDANGVVYFLAYPDASDGATASFIFTDYVELVVNLI